MIGLIDLDLLQSSSINRLIPNIEIMKLAAYYRQEENTFCRLIGLNETDIVDYDKVYLFSEQNQPVIPDNFKTIPNLILGGSGFTGGIYRPFENSLIDFTLPRTLIYKEFLKDKYNDGIKTKVILHTLDDTYYRNYAGERRLPIPVILSRKRVFLYDRDFFYNDWKYTLQSIEKHKPSGIIRIHPIYCNKIQDYLDLRQFGRFSRENLIILDFHFQSLEEVKYFLTHYKKQLLADITPNTNVALPLGRNCVTNSRYYEDLNFVLNCLYLFWAAQIPIKIKFIEPSIGYNNPIANLERAIDIWSHMNIRKRGERTLENTIKLKTRISIEQQEQEQFLQFFPKQHTLFEQSYNDIFARRFWK